MRVHTPQAAIVFCRPLLRGHAKIPDMPTPLELETEPHAQPGTTTIVHCRGRLVMGTHDTLFAHVKPLIPFHPRIILDLSDLKDMDSLGLGTLVHLYVTAKAAGTDLQLRNLAPQVRRLLGTTHLLNVFTVIGESGIKMF